MNEVVSTIMLNFIATGISAFLLSEYFRNHDARTWSRRHEPCRRPAGCPPLNRLLR